MGGSRRRLKRGKSKVRVGVVKRKKNQKSHVPRAVKEEQPGVEKRLNTEVDWQEEKSLISNYKQNALVLDPNEGFGRNAKSAPLKSKEEREEEGKETFSDDDELRVVCNLSRKTGKAPPKRLTTRQRQVIEQLFSKHGDDYEAMFRDIKSNPMQHSVGKLREMAEAYHYWGANSRHDFRAPHKPPKRL